MPNQQQEISVCLSDIPRDKMRKGNNGKIYVNLTISKRKEPDQWNRDLKVYVSQTKEDRTTGATKVYVGGGRTVVFEERNSPPPSQDEMDNVIPPNQNDKEENLPFPCP